MKAYIKDNFVIAIGENDSLFSDCTPIEINENQKEFIEGCKYPKYNGVDFIDEDINIIEVPYIVTNAQFRLALIDAGISISDILMFINSIQDSQKKERLLTLFEYANTFERNNPLLISMANDLNISMSQLDQLFINANNL